MGCSPTMGGQALSSCGSVVLVTGTTPGLFDRVPCQRLKAPLGSFGGGVRLGLSSMAVATGASLCAMTDRYVTQLK